MHFMYRNLTQIYISTETYCKCLNFHELLITRVLQGSLETRNLMLVYENRMPNMTLVKLNDHECQTYPNCELIGLGKLRNLQYILLSETYVYYITSETHCVPGSI